MRIYPFIAFMLLGACGDPLLYSAPVTIDLKAKSGDVKMSVVSDEKGITTETSNPYGKFVGDAKTALEGANPSSIEVDTVRLFLGAGSKGVTKLEEVFGGKTDVLFTMNDSNNSFVVATADSVEGTGPIELSVDFNHDALGTDDQGRLLNGSFKAVIRGPAANAFESRGAEADLELTFAFSAYE